MRLIDADKLVRDIDELSKDAGFYRPIYEGVKNGISAKQTIDAVPVETVAQMFMEFAGHKCACDFNGTDEWLPLICEHEANGKCPDPDDVLDCWKQYIKHYEKRNEEDDE